MRHVKLPSGAKMPVLGLGTWHMGENRRRAKDEAAALRLGLDLGLTLIDTAERYGEGGAEEVVAEAIAGRRDAVYLVSKVNPHIATRRGAVAACEHSLKRLRTDRLDLYLLHWRGSARLADTIAAFHELRAAGKIRDFGVSNFDRDDMEEARSCDQGLTGANQVVYNLERRGIEWDLLPWCREHHVPVMAYSPFDQGRLLDRPKLASFAKERGITPAQACLAWLLHQPGVATIPKSSRLDRVREIRDAYDVKLAAADLAALDRAFPPPKGKAALDML